MLGGHVNRSLGLIGQEGQHIELWTCSAIGYHAVTVLWTR